MQYFIKWIFPSSEVEAEAKLNTSPPFKIVASLAGGEIKFISSRALQMESEINSSP
jgi:hypothetical protein